jgi:adenylate kinase family enzyme
MRKVLVIGSGGAGKSTLARRLSQILNIEVIHLDSLYWSQGWVETPKNRWKERVEELINQDSWIMDGNYSGTLELRLKACDTVIFLDIARPICLWRLFNRRMSYRKRSRPDMAEGCPERLNLEFIAWVWSYRKRTRPKIVKMLKESSGGKKVIWLRSKADVEKFLANPENA